VLLIEAADRATIGAMTRASIEAFAEIACPLRAWRLELVNGAPMDPTRWRSTSASCASR
jgi:hypothetical protein